MENNNSSGESESESDFKAEVIVLFYHHKVKLLVAICHSFWYICFLGLSYSMKTWTDLLHCLACWRGLNVSWSRIKVGLLVVSWDLLWSLKSKSVEKLSSFPPAGLEPMPHATVALTAQYLNVRQLKLGTIIIQTVRNLQHESAVTAFQPTSKWPNPAIVPSLLFTNRGVLHKVASRSGTPKECDQSVSVENSYWHIQNYFVLCISWSKCQYFTGSLRYRYLMWVCVQVCA